MTGPVSKTTIVETCLNGAVEASRFYDEISGGSQLYEAPEWLLQAEIARALGKCCHYVTVESSVKWLVGAASAERRGCQIRNKRGRIDIVVWSSSDHPRYLIEVKKSWDSWSLYEDAKRLRSMLRRGGKFHAGLMVAYATAAREETLDRRFAETAVNSEAVLVKRLPSMPIDPEDPKSWLWSTAVFEVKKALTIAG